MFGPHNCSTNRYDAINVARILVPVLAIFMIQFCFNFVFITQSLLVMINPQHSVGLFNDHNPDKNNFRANAGNLRGHSSVNAYTQQTDLIYIFISGPVC